MFKVRPIAFISIAVMGLAWWWFRNDKLPEPQPIEITQPSAEEVPSVVTLPVSFPTTEAPNAAIKVVEAVAQKPHKNPYSAVAPDLAQYRKEVSENPHDTPESIQNFASSLAPKMKRAKQNLDAAQMLFPDLGSCAQTEDALNAVRAICATNAATLAKIYPNELQTRYIELYDSLPEKIRVMLSSNPHDPQ